MFSTIDVFVTNRNLMGAGRGRLTRFNDVYTRDVFVGDHALIQGAIEVQHLDEERRTLADVLKYDLLSVGAPDPGNVPHWNRPNARNHNRHHSGPAEVIRFNGVPENSNACPDVDA